MADVAAQQMSDDDGVAAIEHGDWSTVNAETGLSTDYLNHFNEAIMLFDLVSQMPECLDDLEQWQPVSYVEHFEHSGLKDRMAAIKAYKACDPTRRKVFDEIILNLSTVLLDGISELHHAATEGHPEAVPLKAQEITSMARQLVDRAAAVVHGNDTMRDPASEGEEDPQALADALFA